MAIKSRCGFLGLCIRKLRWKMETGNFFCHSQKGILDKVVANQTIRNRRQYKMKTPDAIICAMAQVYGFEIVTNNLDLKITTIRFKND